MSQYFDKDFFKFLLAFIMIIAFSLAIVAGAKIYDSSPETESVPDAELKVS